MSELKFVGKAGSGLPGIPGRDLSAEEVDKYGEDELLESGLYQKLSGSSKPKSKRSEKSEGEE